MSMDEKLDSLQRTDRVVQPTSDTMAHAYIKDYETEYQQSIADPDTFWGKVAQELEWFSPWNKVLEWKYPWAKWFVGGMCNISYNCLDRHVKTWRRNKVAIMWVGEQGEERVFTYGELYRQVNRCANALKSVGTPHRRPRHDLFAEDSRASRRHARMRANRGNSQRRLFRVQRAGAGQPDTGCGSACRDHSRCRVRPRENDQLKRRRGSGRCELSVGGNGGRCAARTIGSLPLRAEGSRLERLDEGSKSGVRGRATRLRDPALYSLYIGHDRQAERRRARARRLHGRDLYHDQVHFRPQGRGRLFLRGRPRMGDRTQLYRLWTAAQRRHNRDGRRKARLSQSGPMVGFDRALWRVDLLYTRRLP